MAHPMSTNRGRIPRATWIVDPTAILRDKSSLSLMETVTAQTCSGTEQEGGLVSLSTEIRRDTKELTISDDGQEDHTDKLG